MKRTTATTLKGVLFVGFVVALVSIPFVIFGQDFVLPILDRQDEVMILVLIAIALLAADSVAPVPATIIIMALAAKGGRLAGIVGGTVGLCVGVLAAAWIGRTAVGRLAPKFFRDEDLARLRALLQRRLMITIACLRSVPVLAETSVIVAAAMGIPVRRIFWAAVLPNFIMAVIYSFAASESATVAVVTFVATMLVSYVLWRWLHGRAGAAEATS